MNIPGLMAMNRPDDADDRAVDVTITLTPILTRLLFHQANWQVSLMEKYLKNPLERVDTDFPPGTKFEDTC